MEDALQNDPVAVYEHDIEGEQRFVYYAETNSGRLIGVIVTERGDAVRVITANDLDRAQRRDYLKRRAAGEQG